MKLTSKEALDVIRGDHPDFKNVADIKQIKKVSRWSIHFEEVYYHLPSNKHYLFKWSEAATELQEETPFEYMDFYEPIEVESKLVSKVIWIPVNQ